jgi:hypothetical protein
MKHVFYSILLLFAFSLSTITAKAQGKEIYYFKFTVHDKSELSQITRIVSIDKVKGNEVWAYANQREMVAFSKTGYSYELLKEERLDSKAYTMATTVADMSNWNRYPTYEVYVQMMTNFATNYPSICKLEEIGTLPSGRKLLAVKISDNVNSNNEAEPELLYTSTIHGDECTGYIFLLRLIDYMLTNYGNSSYPDVNNLVNNSEIWICPDANPDGTYHGGNSTVSGSQRYNANSVDLNRNYPDPQDGDHPDGENWQPETQAFMTFAENHHFTIAANFHGGTEVVNYPWDTWSRRTADDAWWQMVGHAYADEAQTDANNNGYMSGYDDGITDGYDWYEVNGGRQDYMNYWYHCREVTIEVSETKLVSSDALPNYWTYNRDALINYLKEGSNGVRGTVKDGYGNPLAAKVEVVGHEQDNSWVETDPRAGDYYRLIKAGTYSIKFSSNGFDDKVISNVTVVDGQPTVLNVIMAAPEPILQLNRENIVTNVVLDKNATEALIISNIGGADLNYSINVENAGSNTWITLSRTSGVVTSGSSQTINVVLNASGLSETTHTCNLIITGDSSVTVPVSMTVYTTPEMTLDHTSYSKAFLTNESGKDSLLISNIGNANLNYTIAVNQAAENPWMTLSSPGGLVAPGQSNKIIINFDPAVAGVGVHNTKLVIGGDFPTNIPVSLDVDTIPLIKLGAGSLSFAKLVSQTELYNLSIKNIGGGKLNYTAEVVDAGQHTWLTIQNPTGSLNTGVTGSLKLNISAIDLVKDVYTAQLKVNAPTDTVIIPVVLTVDNLPEFYVADKIMEMELFEGTISKDTVTVTNTGGSVLTYNISITYTNGSAWLIPQTTSGTLTSQESIDFICSFDARSLQPGEYNATIHFSGSVDYDEPAKLTVMAKPELSVNVSSLSHSLTQVTSCTDTIVLSNIGGGVLPYTVKFDNTAGYSWVSVNKTSGEIVGGNTDTLLLTFDAIEIAAGNYTGKLIISTATEKRIPLSLEVIENPKLTVDQSNIVINANPDKEQTGSFLISNIGGSTLVYAIAFVGDAPSWFSTTSEWSGSLTENQSDQFNYTVNTTGLITGQYTATLRISSGDQSSDVVFTLNILTGIASRSEVKATIWPNPFTAEVTVTCPAVSGTDNGQLLIYNIIGGKVFQIEAKTNSNGQLIFIWDGNSNTGETLPKGAYLYRIILGNQTLTGKILKQ